MTTSAPIAPTAPTDAAQFARDWQAWHDELEEGRRAPHGFLAYTSLSLIHI